jgi:hypothetical protein
MADTLPFRCRIAALETELRLVKEQLVQSQNGGQYLIGMLGHQPQLGIQVRHDQEIETIRAQLDDSLQCNARLESLLATSHRARTILETRAERLANADLRALKRAAVEQWDAGVEGSKRVHGSDGVGDVLAVEKRQANAGVGASKRADEDSVKDVFEAEVDAMIRGDEGEDLLSWASSEKGVRDGWAAMEEKTGDADVVAVLKPAVNGVQVKTSDEKKDTEIAPEVGTARSVHIRSNSREDVKSYDIQPAAAPLQHSQWSLPGNRWPAQRPRPYARQPYQPYQAHAEIPNYNVTHSFYSTDPSLRRTVLVTNIPVGMVLSDVLDEHLKSDRILAAKFAGTAGMKTTPPIESNAAIIEFLDNGDAQIYVDVYAGHKVFGLMIVATPTRPLRRARVDSGYY